MPDTIAIHERLATLEAGQDYTNKTLDEVKTMLRSHTSGACDGACDVGKQIAPLKSAVTTYKRLTWTSLVIIIAAGVKSLFPA